MHRNRGTFLPVGRVCIRLLLCPHGHLQLTHSYSATAISFGQTITISTILEKLPSRLPDLRANAVLKAGAAGLSQLVSSPADLAILKSIWNVAISRTMILAAVVIACSVPFTIGMEWLNVKKVAEAQKLQAASGHEDKE